MSIKYLSVCLYTSIYKVLDSELLSVYIYNNSGDNDRLLAVDE